MINAGTISSGNGILPLVSTTCIAGLNCNGSEDFWLRFPKLSSYSHDLAWSSTMSALTPYYFGKSGYFAVDTHSAYSDGDDMGSHQRPAQWLNLRDYRYWIGSHQGSLRFIFI